MARYSTFMMRARDLGITTMTHADSDNIIDEISKLVHILLSTSLQTTNDIVLG